MNAAPDTLGREQAGEIVSAEGNTHEQPLGTITVPIGTTLHEAERTLILATLERCGGVRKRTAALLGISLKTLYNRLMAYRPAAGPTGRREP